MTDEEKLPMLQTQRKERWHDLKLVHDLVLDAEESAKNLRAAYQDLKLAYEQVDRELAMLDGRYQKVENQAQNRKKVSEDLEAIKAKLTEAQIDELLKELGVSVPEVEEVPLPEEIVALPEEKED